MTDENFKTFLEGLETEDNSKLMKTILTGYKQLFEGDMEEDAPEAEEAPEAPEEAPEAPEEMSEEAPESMPEEGGMTEANEANKTNSNKKFIEDLNGDLSREYAAAIQYIQHAAMVTGAQYMTIAEEMLVHADEEIAHAKELSDKINYLGGVPTVVVSPIKLSNDSAEMVAQDKEGEEEAIQRYRERIKQAESMGDFATKKMLMSILGDEEEHRNDLMVALGQ